MSGRIRGHDDLLPPETVRCANCHEAAGATKISRTSAPYLNRSWLLDARQRRSGPPSRYDEAAFCKLLRTGVDPVSIVIAREMPAYVVNDDQCAGLWAYLLERETHHHE
jgi:hypothetical protein